MNKIEKGIKKLFENDNKKKIHKKERTFILLNVPNDIVKEVDKLIRLYTNAKKRIIVGCVSNEPITISTQKKIIKALNVVIDAKMSKKPIDDMVEEIYGDLQEIEFNDPKDTRYIG